ncbi:STAS domain-containing protein [Mycolicibacterium arenosum]|uniref:Anti-sigma factor antagonist n=1 Tax=Mycolicibacterium arenosum TaxID=2952157 RepID=A0ABT1LZ58_9MYCO|nr:STAS domain-containing protein [Mycolicibacterium sp. CAU 1645]MCP9271880.1 STAS domain-containing protein [Mycolicibacterium sp. CAU 1645]
MSDTGASTGGFAAYGVTRRREDQTIVLSVTGALDILTAGDFTQDLLAAIGEAPQAVIVDMSRLDFLASAGMSALVEGHRAAGPGTKLAVVADGPATSRPLTITGLTELIALYPTLADAVTDLGA